MNALSVLFPYKYEGTWVFGDLAVGLAREPFVPEMDEMMTRLTRSVSNVEAGFSLLYSNRPFPGCAARLEWRREGYGGNWYHCPQFEIEGWLCPALLKDFDQAPTTLHATAESKRV